MTLIGGFLTDPEMKEVDREAIVPLFFSGKEGETADCTVVVDMQILFAIAVQKMKGIVADSLGISNSVR